jgi:pyruvate dehydrogenase complex dehydrogenase (E1) component
MTRARLEHLVELERRLLWLATWTIHNANHLREAGEVKVGGHQASSASLATIMTALYFGILRPEDRVAVKPHASAGSRGRKVILRARRMLMMSIFQQAQSAWVWRKHYFPVLPRIMSRRMAG